MNIRALDDRFINLCSHHGIWFSRLALFIVFFWFGALKIVAESPANPLVADLLERTLPFITFDQFIVLFSIFEMTIGTLFLIPKATRLVLLLLAIHMCTTFMPLILLPAVTWQSFLVPTLEGQYIVKNIIIIALAFNIAASLQSSRPHAAALST